MPVDSLVSPRLTNTVAQTLLHHYDQHARELPWRLKPGSIVLPDPYHVWLSEIMLQQTTVAAVIPYYVAFTARWPTVEALANAQEAEVMAAWAGLGYYARARNLLTCARVVVADHGGRFPDNEEALLTLPGIGTYTAAAITAIAFDRRAVVVDANVERVVTRLFAIATPLPASRPEIRAATDRVTPQNRVGDFAQAMMDLGSAICTIRAPRCLLCPLRSACAAHSQGSAEKLPAKLPKKPKPHRFGTVWWIERDDGHVWVERRGAKRMLGGMAGLPDSPWDARGGAQVGEPPLAGSWVTLNMAVDHVFTHFRLTLTVEKLKVDSDLRPDSEGQWLPLTQIGQVGLPSLFAKVAQTVMGDANA